MLGAGLDPFHVRRLGFALLLALAACQVDEPNLSQTQSLIVVLAPATYNFGSQQVGTSSANYLFSVNPGFGENYDVVTAVVENCPDFAVSAVGLPAAVYRTCLPYQECPKFQICEQYSTPICETDEYVTYEFTGRFTPTVAGNVSCTVGIQLQDGTVKTLTLSGSGTVPPKDIDVAPTAVNFGDVRKDTASTGVGINVRNVGGTAMTVTSVSISSGFSIASGPTGQYGLAAGATQPYSITCNPTSVGNMSGSMTVTSDDPSTPNVTVALSCRGIDSAVALSPSPTTIPNTRVGEPVQQSISIVNSGAASMVLEGITVSGTDLVLMSAPGNGTYGTGTVGSAVVRFGAAEGGTQSGTLTITYDGGKTRTSAISARALATSMSMSPDGDVNFGPVCAGQAASQTFTILANDEGYFNVTQLGGLTPPFTAMMPTLPAAVQGSGANMVSFIVTTEPETAGMQTSELQLATNIPGSAPRTINLSVDALPAGVSPSPIAVDFGSAPPMTTTIGQSIFLSNCSTSAATFTNPRIEGDNATEFAIVQQPMGTSIEANGKVSWLVVLTAQTPGTKHAEFVVDYEGGTARVPLDGEGLGADVGGEEPGAIDEVSYYSCSTTGSSSRAWPLVLVLGIVLRRRRRR